MTKPITTVIHDTIVIRDTIYKTLSTTKIDKADIYKDILENQTETYNTILVVFLGIIALFAGATYLYNTKIAKSEMIKHADEIFNKEKDVILSKIKEDFEEEMNMMKGDNARLYAVNSNGTEGHKIATSLHWWCLCIDYYRLAKNGAAVRFAVENAIVMGNKSLTKRVECKEKLLQIVPNIETLITIFDKLPDELSDEKKELKKIITDIFSTTTKS